MVQTNHAFALSCLGPFVAGRLRLLAAAVHAFPQIFNRDLLFISVSHRYLSKNLPAANADVVGLFNLPAAGRPRAGSGRIVSSAGFVRDSRTFSDARFSCRELMPLLEIELDWT